MDFSLLFSSPVLTWDAVPMINPRRRTYGSDCSTCWTWPSNSFTQSQQQLLLRAFTPPQPLASGVIHWGTHIFILGFRHSARRGGGTVPGQLQVAVPCLLSSRTVRYDLCQQPFYWCHFLHICSCGCISSCVSAMTANMAVNITVILVQSYHSFSKVGGSGFQYFFTCWTWPANLLTQAQQQLLLQAFTPPQPLTSGVIWGERGRDTHFHFGFLSQC